MIVLKRFQDLCGLRMKNFTDDQKIQLCVLLGLYAGNVMHNSYKPVSKGKEGSREDSIFTTSAPLS